jgi:hypothetical protein
MKKNNSLDIEELIQKYQYNKNDSLKLICAEFLNEKMDVNSKYGGLVTNDFIKENIDQTVWDWQHCLWNANSSKDMILNYLLPYNVSDEDASEWRDYFSNRYRLIKDSFITSKIVDTRKVYDRLINKDINLWLRYSGNTSDFNFSFTQTIKEKKAGCFGMACMYAYALRSLGIPATVDIVPLWGSQNAGHAEVVFCDSSGHMCTYEKDRLTRSAKVFRYIFNTRNAQTDLTQSAIGGYEFILSDLLSHNNWVDVTQQHNNVSTVKYRLPLNYTAPFAYICVYNYGKWQPVFYGLVGKNNMVEFSNMGCNILYQIAVPKKDGYELILKPFILDSLGKIKSFSSDFVHLINMKLQKINTGDLSYVKEGRNYKLYLLDQQSQWKFLYNVKCFQDCTISIKNVPANGIYKLKDLTATKRLERPFTYKHENQIWW